MAAFDALDDVVVSVVGKWDVLFFVAPQEHDAQHGLDGVGVDFVQQVLGVFAAGG